MKSLHIRAIRNYIFDEKSYLLQIDYHKNDENKLNNFIKCIDEIYNQTSWNKEQIMEIFNQLYPNFSHIETGKYLDQKM